MFELNCETAGTSRIRLPGTFGSRSFYFKTLPLWPPLFLTFPTRCKGSTHKARINQLQACQQSGARQNAKIQVRSQRVFKPIADDKKDHISTLPSETLDQILSYCVLDHEPEYAVRAQYTWPKKRSHVFLSLAAMSSHFRGHVEDFSRRQLINNKESYCFKTNAELAGDKRRSLRLHTPPRCYRFELVAHLQKFCVRCNRPSSQFAVMANAVICCQRCARLAFPGQIVSVAFPNINDGY